MDFRLRPNLWQWRLSFWVFFHPLVTSKEQRRLHFLYPEHVWRTYITYITYNQVVHLVQGCAKNRPNRGFPTVLWRLSLWHTTARAFLCPSQTFFKRSICGLYLLSGFYSKLQYNHTTHILTLARDRPKLSPPMVLRCLCLCFYPGLAAALPLWALSSHSMTRPSPTIRAALFSLTGQITMR